MSVGLVKEDWTTDDFESLESSLRLHTRSLSVMVKVETKEPCLHCQPYGGRVLLLMKVAKYTTDDPKFVKGLKASK